MKPRSTALATPAGRAGPLAGTLRAGIAAVLISAAIGLAGCTPDPAPQPTPTPLFASEAEAFTAAEQVYRDYTDASNERRDGKADADPQNFLSGQALEDDINAQRTLRAKRLKVVGPNRVTSFRAFDYDQARGQIGADVCIDVTESRVLDDSGEDVTPSSRASLVALHVVMTQEHDRLQITSAVAGKHSCTS